MAKASKELSQIMLGREPRILQKQLPKVDNLSPWGRVRSPEAAPITRLRMLVPALPSPLLDKNTELKLPWFFHQGL